MNIAQISTGFLEVPSKISLNIYTQGCSFKCPGCQNEHLRKFGEGKEINFWEIENILDEYDMCTWVCWLGGNPTDQPDELEVFNREIKRYGKKICLYTGHRIEEIQDLIEDVDLIIDGQYIENKGPITNEYTNQRIWIKKFENWHLIRKWRDLNKEL